MTVGNSGSISKPTIYEDSERGKVLHQYRGETTSSNSYTRMPNPLYNSSAEEFTVNFWVKPVSRSKWGDIFSFFKGASPTAEGGRFYITDNSYIGYNGSAGWFDINHPDTVTYYDIPLNEWSMVTMTAAASGVTFYVNGYPHPAKQWNSSTGTEKDFNYTGMLSDISTYPYMYLGTGSWWGSSECYLSDLRVFDRSLSESDIQALKAQPLYVRGDANNDGEVGMPDVMFVVNYILGSAAETFNLKNADANLDGEIGMPDVMFIVQYILNGKFPEE
jgi:arabinan endo-1,5-alpha-L-arabinosidase